MSSCDKQPREGIRREVSCGAEPSPCCGGSGGVASVASPAEWFAGMTANSLAYAQQAKNAGRPIVGILCEFTPRELILAAGGVPVVLCGGSGKPISAAEEYLPANLCPLIKSTFGYHVLRSNPFLEMADLIVAETTCDGKKKMYELLAQSRAMYVLELPQKPDDPDAFEHWRRELVKLRDFLSDRYGVALCDERLREAIAVMNRERALRRSLAELMQRDAPPLTGRQLIEFKSNVSGNPADLQQYERALAEYTAFPSPGDTANRVRVLLTGVPMAHGAERVLDILEQSGGLVVAMENCTGLKPIVQDVDATAADPLEAIARKYFHLPCSVMTNNRRRFDLLRRLVREYRPHCVVDLIWQACLTYDVESHGVRRMVEEELGLPYLRIETDYSPADSPRIAVRVEALLETVHRRQSHRGVEEDKP